MKQRTDEWFHARLGKVTASRVADVVAETRSGYSKSRENYKMELLIERLTGQREEGYVSAAMQRGTDEEPMAISAYEAIEGVMVEPVGFVDHPTIPMSGASPDGLVGDDGLVEVKCPNTAQHVETLLERKVVDKKYLIQIQWQLACTGRQWCHYVSYDSRMPAHLSLVIIRVPRSDAVITGLEIEVRKFLAELDELVEQLK